MPALGAPVLGLLGITLNPVTLAKDVADAFFNAALGLFGTGASDLVTALLGFVTTTSDPVFSGGWWSSSGTALFERVLVVAGSLLALAFMCSVITALLSADRTLLVRAAVRLPVAVLEMALLVGVTAALVSASDEVSAEIASGATTTLQSFVAVDFAGVIAGTGIVGLLAGGLVILAALGLWAELLCRSALIYLVVLAGPLIFAASVHPSARGLRRRYLEAGLALICSKIVVALALATGSAMITGLGDSSSFAAATGALLEALAVLLVACFSPFLLLRLLIGAEAIVAAEGLGRRPLHAVLDGASTAQRASGVASMARRLTGPDGPSSSGRGGRGPGGGAPPTSGREGGPPPRPPAGPTTQPMAPAQRATTRSATSPSATPHNASPNGANGSPPRSPAPRPAQPHPEPSPVNTRTPGPSPLTPNSTGPSSTGTAPTSTGPASASHSGAGPAPRPRRGTP